jgi:ribonuclease-3
VATNRKSRRLKGETKRPKGAKIAKGQKKGLEVKPEQLDASMLIAPSLNNGWQLDESVLDAFNCPPDYAEKLLLFQDRFDIQFRNEPILRRALRHHSFTFNTSNKAHLINNTQVSNRSMEFLGDSVLGMAATSFLFQAFPAYSEG